MNTSSNPQTNAVPVSVEIPTVAPPSISPTRIFYWSVRRELWEYRSLYLAPLVVAGIALIGFLIASLGRALTTQDMALRRKTLEEPLDFAALLIMLTTFIVAVFYCLDALHGERRDRSILFWKSLPVSDLTTVLAKASIPLAVLPLITFAITIAMQWIMLLISTTVLMGSGLSVAGLWSHAFEMALALLYHLLAIHSLWYAPMFGWMLLVSAWARRAPFLWALLPLLVIGVLEKIAFNTTHFGAMLGHRFAGGSEAGPFTAGSMAMDPLMHLTPGRFLMSSGLWIGLAITAAFLATAVRLRRYRGPI
jgi:ABC-2 type transport system permease protein